MHYRIHFIFKSRSSDNDLAEFSEHIHNFDYHDWVDETESISEETSLEGDYKDLFDDEIDTACLKSSSMKRYWLKELADMKTNDVHVKTGHEPNKYFMRIRRE